MPQPGVRWARPLLVERYVAGDEVAVEGMLTDGVLSTLAIFDKPDPLTGPYFEETIYVTPSRHHPDLLVRVKDEIGRARAAIGLVDCPVHAEALALAVRCRSRRRGHRPRGRGADDRRQVLEGAPLRLEPFARRARARDALPASTMFHLPASPALSGVMMIPIRRAGRFEGVDGRDEALAVEHVTELEITVPSWFGRSAWPEGDRYLGFLFAVGRTTPATWKRRCVADVHLSIEITKEPDS